MKSYSIVIVACISILLSSCGMQHKFASSFGKRRYTKGYFVDIPANVKTPAIKNVTDATVKIAVAKAPQMAHIVLPKNMGPNAVQIEQRAIGTNKLTKMQQVRTKVFSFVPSLNSVKAITSHRHESASPENGANGLYTGLSALFFFLPFIITIVAALGGALANLSSAAVYAFVLGMAALLIASAAFAVMSIYHEDTGYGLAILILVLDILILAIIFGVLGAV